MPIRFFGQFLLENRVISPAQLLGAIEQQDKTNLRFGETAVSLGLLTEDKVAAILAAQRTRDVRAGEAAVMLGLLTETQVQQVLRAQKNSHIMLGDALVATGGLSRGDLEAQLALFAKDQEPFRVTVDVPPALDKTGVGRPAIDLAIKLLLRVANVTVKLRNCRVGPLVPSETLNLAARVSYGGDVEGELILRGGAKICGRIAHAMLGEPASAESAVVEAMGELVNVIGGNLCAELARRGKKMELGTPRPGADPASAFVLIAQLTAPEGDLEFAVPVTKY
jgi:CheY-specific phosphatase CheX